MAIKSGIKVEGLNGVIRNLRELQVDVTDMKSAFSKMGNVVAEEAKRLVPYRTGVLQGSIRTSKARNKATVRAGSARARYAPFVEFGTYKDPEQAFLRGAVRSTRGRVLYEFQKEIRALVRQANN